MNYKKFLELLIQVTIDGCLKWKNDKFRHTDHVDQLGCAPEAIIANSGQYDIMIIPYVIRDGDVVRIVFSLAVYDDTYFDISGKEDSHIVSSDFEILSYNPVPLECNHLIFKLYMIARCLWMYRSGVTFYLEYPRFNLRDPHVTKFIPKDWPLRIFLYRKDDKIEEALGGSDYGLR